MTDRPYEVTKDVWCDIATVSVWESFEDALAHYVRLCSDEPKSNFNICNTDCHDADWEGEESGYRYYNGLTDEQQEELDAA